MVQYVNLSGGAHAPGGASVTAKLSRALRNWIRTRRRRAMQAEFRRAFGHFDALSARRAGYPNGGHVQPLTKREA